MIRFRKKKLTAREAAKIYLENLHQIIEQTWPLDLEKINEYYPEYSLIPNDTHVKVDLFLCIISLELQVISNRFPQNRKDIERSIINELTENYSNGSHGVEIIINDYLPEIEYAVRKGLSTLDAAVHIFSGRLDLDVDVNVDLLKKAAIAQLIVTKIGIWNKIFKEYKIK